MIEWRFKVVQAERNMSNKEAAAAIGVSPGTVSGYRQSMPRLTLESLEKICQGLHCQPGELMTWKDKNNDD